MLQSSKGSFSTIDESIDNTATFYVNILRRLLRTLFISSHTVLFIDVDQGMVAGLAGARKRNDNQGERADDSLFLEYSIDHLLRIGIARPIDEFLAVDYYLNLPRTKLLCRQLPVLNEQYD